MSERQPGRHGVVVLDNIDLDLLLRQKREIVKLLWRRPDTDIRWGVVHLLDVIHDQLDPPATKEDK